MRKFKFFALAFAAIAFAGCSDDALDGQGGNTGTVGDGTPAYLTISFSANSGSSSRVSDSDGNNTGDKDNAEDTTGQEDSGHSNNGTTDENAVKRALVVVSPVEGNVGFAKLYTLGQDGNLSLETPGENDPEDVFTITDNKSQTYHNADPIEVSTGTYNILVVINPVDDITEDLGTTLQLTSGPSVRALYEKIIDGKYVTKNGIIRPMTSQDGDTYITEMGNSTDGFMMANKSLVQETLTSSHTPDAPLDVSVDVERVISKITYRESDTYKNIYPVDVYTGSVQAKTVRGLVKNTEGETTTYILHIFNEARDANETTPKEVYALYVESEENEDETEFSGVYRKTDEEITVWTKTAADGSIEVKTEQPMTNDNPAEPDDTYTRETLHVFVGGMEAKTQEDYNKGTEEQKLNWFVAKDIPAEGQDEGDGTLSDAEIESSLILQLTQDNAEGSTKWYVKLEGYALVNLSKEVNYVRHITDARGVGAPFGTLNGSNFLYTPGFDDKNRIDFDAANFVQATFEEQAKGWYYNSLAEVSKESESLVIDNGVFKKTNDEGTEVDADCYHALPALNEDNDGDESVSGGGSQHEEPLANIGELMSYCFENSTNVDNQVHGLSTGISFVAGIYTDANCNTAVDGLYYYSGYIFESLSDIQKAFGVNTPKPIKDLIEAGEENATKTQLVNAGITPYTDNTCYYYTTRIKHFDNDNDSEPGNMEFAIMRNNIYSLSVTGIREIGAPFVDPTPSIPNESDEAAISIQVNMVPWIVRYNDIEF